MTQRRAAATHSAAPARGPIASRIDRLRVRHLRLLECTAECGSLSAAAQRLQLSQPGATKMLQELESAFGCSLIERTPRGATLSVAGAAALRRLRIALGMLDAATAALASQPEQPLVRLGMLPLVAVNALPSITAALDRTGAMPRMTIREATVEGLMQLLQNGELDCVVSRLEAGMEDPGELRIVRLWEDALAMAAATTHPLARKRKLPAELLQQARWVLPFHGAATRVQFDQWFLEAGVIPPLPHIESLSFHTSLSLAAGSSLLTIAPQSAVRHYQARGMVRELPLARPMPHGALFFITRQELAKLPEVALVMQALQDFARTQAASPGSAGS